MEAAAYLRVSTDDQSCDNQRPELCRLAEARGAKIVEFYEEKVSAAKARPEYERLMVDAHRGKFCVLLVWSLDRLGRSMVNNLAAVLELDRIGVQVVSVKEPWLDTGGPVRQLLVAIFSWVAEQERCRISERTKAGLERARRRGSRIGRPAAYVDVDKARALRAAGLSVRAVAKKLGVGATTVHRALASTGT